MTADDRTRRALTRNSPGTRPVPADEVDPLPPEHDTRWNGATLLAAVRVAGADLHAARAAINALNVFPVPDGDTGTNMDLTMAAALAEAATLADDPDAGAAEVAARLARGALLGARGNSGVILSQILRGVADGLARHAAVEPRDVARALASASEAAYRAVLKPVEGTMLTVIRGASDGAAAAMAADAVSVAVVLGGARRGAEAALATTPDLLDVLRQAGVVDAGGQGVVVLIAGLDRFARGGSAPAATVLAPPTGDAAAFAAASSAAHGADDYGYCTNVMVTGTGIDVDAARLALGRMGDSAVIVGDDTTLKVHVHVDDPGAVLSYAIGLGDLSEIRIDNMRLQTAASRPPVAAVAAPTAPVALFGRQAVLAVAAGEGLADALRSMGASGVIDGGGTMNPSTEELLAAVEASDAAEVILLPNHPNVLMAADQVRDLTERALRVVPTRSVPQGIAALSSFNADADLDANVVAMTAAMSHVHTVQLTTAARDATVNGVEVRAGQVILLIDGELCAAGDDGRALLEATLAEARFAATELVTLYTGADATDDELSRLTALVGQALPDAEIETHPGGQPLYHFIISLE